MRRGTRWNAAKRKRNRVGLVMVLDLLVLLAYKGYMDTSADTTEAAKAAVRRAMATTALARQARCETLRKAADDAQAAAEAAIAAAVEARGAADRACAKCRG